MSQVAQVILHQLCGGPGRLQVMTGAKSIAGMSNGVQFKINGRCPGKGTVTHVRIILTSADLYDVEYLRIRAGKVTEVAKSEGIFADMLKDDFEHNTQMYLSL